MAVESNEPFAAAAGELPGPLRLRVARLVAEQATRSERMLSLARAAFCLLVLVRFLALGGGGGGGAASWITVPALTLAVVFSLRIVLRPGVLPTWLLDASGLVDAAVCFAALLPDILWPWHAYHGLLMTPDVTAILLVVCVSGLRLSPRLALQSALANALGGVILVALDARLNAHRSEVEAQHVALALLWLLAAGWVAVTFARRGAELASRSALESLRGTFATQNLRALLAGHHDSRTLLSSATLHSDLLSRRLRSRRSPADADLQELALALQRDLTELGDFERSIKEHAWGAVVSQGALLPADPDAALAAATRTVRRLFPDVSIGDDSTSVGSERGPLTVLASGGTAALERALQNLLVNACEGDGRRGASRVRVQLSVATGTEPGAAPALTVRLDDDGPGFDPSRLEAPARRATTKDAGSGLGLVLVRNFAEASGGALALGNTDAGARVALVLPIAPRDETRPREGVRGRDVRRLGSRRAACTDGRRRS